MRRTLKFKPEIEEKVVRALGQIAKDLKKDVKGYLMLKVFACRYKNLPKAWELFELLLLLWAFLFLFRTWV